MVETHLQESNQCSNIASHYLTKNNHQSRNMQIIKDNKERVVSLKVLVCRLSFVCFPRIVVLLSWFSLKFCIFVFSTMLPLFVRPLHSTVLLVKVVLSVSVFHGVFGSLKANYSRKRHYMILVGFRMLERISNIFALQRFTTRTTKRIVVEAQ